MVVYAYMCVCAFSLHRESPDMILGDKPLISEVVLSHTWYSNYSVIYNDLHLCLVKAINLSLVIRITRIDRKVTLYN
jgi:hypothetical protein